MRREIKVLSDTADKNIIPPFGGRRRGQWGSQPLDGPRSGMPVFGINSGYHRELPGLLGHVAMDD